VDASALGFEKFDRSTEPDLGCNGA